MNVILFVYIEDYTLLNNICNYLSFATGIPALICFGKTYLDFSNTFSTYCQKLSYVFYIIHFPVVVLCQYFIWIEKMAKYQGMDEVEKYIDLIPILENLYYDVETFLKPIKEVRIEYT